MTRNDGLVVQDIMKMGELLKAKGMAFHCDGARLWEAEPFYGKPMPELCASFDSVYVSFYKVSKRALLATFASCYLPQLDLYGHTAMYIYIYMYIHLFTCFLPCFPSTCMRCIYLYSKSALLVYCRLLSL